MAAPKKTENRTLTINEPWRLPIPAEIFESIQAVSKLTGQPAEQLIAQTIAHNWPEVRAEKKKSTTERIRLLAQDGLTVQQISQRLGLSWWVVYKAGRRIGIRRFSRVTPEKRREVIEVLRGDRMGLREVAAVVGLGFETVRRIRMVAMPVEPDTVRPHRCPGCGGMITAPQCLRCSKFGVVA